MTNPWFTSTRIFTNSNQGWPLLVKGLFYSLLLSPSSGQPRFIYFKYCFFSPKQSDFGRSEYSLNVKVIDQNDNPPVLQAPYIASISENVNSTMVMQVKAVDHDSSPEFREVSTRFLEKRSRNGVVGKVIKKKVFSFF